MNCVCLKCKKPIEDKHFLIQGIVYLGESGKRLEICPECYAQFLDWLGNPDVLPLFPPLKEKGVLSKFATEADLNKIVSLTSTAKSPPFEDTIMA